MLLDKRLETHIRLYVPAGIQTECSLACPWNPNKETATIWWLGMKYLESDSSKRRPQISSGGVSVVACFLLTSVPKNIPRKTSGGAMMW